jgi:hypothetical protein
MSSLFTRLFRRNRFHWTPAVTLTDPRVSAALRTFSW